MPIIATDVELLVAGKSTITVPRMQIRFANAATVDFEETRIEDLS